MSACPAPLFGVAQLVDAVFEWTRIRDLRRERGDAQGAELAEERRVHFATLLERARKSTSAPCRHDFRDGDVCSKCDAARSPRRGS